MALESRVAGAPRPSSRPSSRLSLIAALLLALTAPLLGAASPAVASTRAQTQNGMAEAVLQMLNGERHAHHLPALTMRPALRLSAHRHDVAMARCNTLSHQVPHEAFFADRISAAGYHWIYAGENIAWNSQMTVNGVLAVQREMYNEKAPDDGHRVNILSRHYRDIGVDVLIDSAHHKVWLTTDFGSR